MRLKQISIFIVAFFGLWFLSWILHDSLANIWPNLLQNESANLTYWALMKVLVWILFPYIYVLKIIKPESTKSFLGLKNSKKGIIYGLVAGLIWTVISVVAQQPSFDVAISLVTIWLITGTPIAEEFTFRGVILPGLEKCGMKFWPANIVTSLLFLLVHFLGWAFQGSLVNNLTVLLLGSILLLSLAVGWLRQKTESLYGSIILHAINNFVSTL